MINLFALKMLFLVHLVQLKHQSCIVFTYGKGGIQRFIIGLTACQTEV